MDNRTCIAAGLIPLGLVLLVSTTALAHTSERAYILLLPTNLYVLGGGVVVAISFLVMAVIPSSGLQALERMKLVIGAAPRLPADFASYLSLALLLALIYAGYQGSRDPLANPLPLTIWSLGWVGLSFLCALLGNLWSWLNPWRGLYQITTTLPGLSGYRAAPPFDYPKWLADWPAVLLFFAFAWFELVHPAPQDPELLANAVCFYSLVTLAGMVLFGADTWLRHGDAFSMFFRIVAWLSPFGAQGEKLSLTLPGMKLLGARDLRVSGVAFVLLALSAVSYDGLSRTFWWLDLMGENPLEYPGRTSLMTVNTWGLLGVFVALGLVFTAVVWSGARLARNDTALPRQLGLFVASIVPIAFGYHFAHYLPEFMLDVQYALRALSDPYALGWNLLGGRDFEVDSSFLGDHRLVELIWKTQVAAIVVAHVVAVGVSHFLAIGQTSNLGSAILSQAPMTALMIGYTLFGLWLLATPVVG